MAAFLSSLPRWQAVLLIFTVTTLPCTAIGLWRGGAAADPAVDNPFLNLFGALAGAAIGSLVGLVVGGLLGLVATLVWLSSLPKAG